MALNLPAAITVTANVQGNQSLNTLARQLQQLSASSQLSGRSLDRLYTETRKLGSAAGNTISSLQAQSKALRSLRDEAEFGSRKFRLLTKDIEAVEARLKKYQQTASQTGGLSKGSALLAGFAGGVAGYVTSAVTGGAMDAVKGIAEAGLNAETAQVRLKSLTSQFGEYNQAQVATERIAKTLRISQTEATDSFSQLYAALRPTGVTLKETEDAFVGFTAAARASGATSTESAAALMQLKQALGSGVLQGDELRSIREQAPLVGQAIAKEMGVTVGELKQLGSEGKITTDIVLKALATLKDENLDKLNASFDTGAQAIKDFQVATENLGKALSRIFGPTTIALIRDVTRGLQDMTDVLGNGAGDKDAEARLRDKIKARDMAADETGKRFGISGLWRQGERESFFQQRQQQILDRLEEERLVKKEQQAAFEAEVASAKEAANKDQQRNKDESAAERQAARDRASAAAREDEVKIREEAEKKLGDAARQREQQLADFRLETVKKAKELERQLGDQRLQIEREIQANQRAAARSRQDIGLERQLQDRRAQGLSVSGIEEAKAMNELFRQFEDQVIQARQTAQDRQMALQRQLEEFKVSIAEGIGKIQEAYARSVSSILQDAGDKLAKKMVDGAKEAKGELTNGSLTPGSVPGGSLGINTLVGLAKGAGFTGQNAAVMAAIAMAESSGSSRAHNQNWKTGDNSYGLWQVNMLGEMGPRRRQQFGIANNDALFDPATNAMAAAQVYRSQGFGAWSVYRSGAYKAYLPAAQAALGAAPATMTAGASSPDLDKARSGVSAAGAKFDAVAKQAQASARDSAFASLIGGIQGRFSGATAELDAQKKAAKDRLEDERRYQVLLSQGITPELAQQRVELERIATNEKEKLEAQRNTLDKQIASGQYSKEEVTVLQQQRDEIQKRITNQGESIAKTEEEIAAAKRLKKAREDSEGRSIGKGLQDGVKSYLEEMGTLAEGIAGVTKGALKGLEDQLVNFVTTGKANFKELARSILADMSRIIIQQMVMKPLLQGLGGLFGVKFADGGIMTDNGPMPLRKYAGGGIANTPQLAMFGEGSTPEAYVPLPDGRRIPVALRGAGGGGGNPINVSVSVDAKGTSVQGDGGRGEQLGRVVAQAVQAELIKQKRPGGLLTA